MKRKKCPKCKCEKLLDSFYFKQKENRYSSWCKECVYKLQKQRWLDRKKKAVELMGGKCCKCGYNKNCAALDFHHLDPSEKSYDWGTLRLRSWANILEELKKCVMLCKNCHAELHYPEIPYNGEENNRLNHTIHSTGECPICEGSVFGTTYCSSNCAAVSKRKVQRPKISELKVLLEQKSYCAIARDYGVSDNAVRKWAKTYGLI